LPSFDPSLASRATRELERLGVQVWTHSRVTGISPRGVRVGEDQLSATTVLWAAGVQASPLGRDLGGARDPQGRVLSGFRSRLLVVLKWGWSYLTFARGSRLIQSQGWRSYPDPPRVDAEPASAAAWAPSSRPPASGLRELEEEAHPARQGALAR
jgi:hypothetical protein